MRIYIIGLMHIILLTGCNSMQKKKTYLYGYKKPLCESAIIKIPKEYLKDVNETPYNFVILSLPTPKKELKTVYSTSAAYTKNSIACFNTQAFDKKIQKKRIQVGFNITEINKKDITKLQADKKIVHSQDYQYKHLSVSIRNIPYRPQVKYPRRAIRKALYKGSVTLTFNINEAGRAVDIAVIKSTNRAFNRTAKKAIRRSIFDTSQFDHLPKPYLQKAQTTMDFLLE